MPPHVDSTVRVPICLRIVANPYGTPAQLDEIAAVCEAYGAICIYDAAEILGAI